MQHLGAMVLGTTPAPTAAASSGTDATIELSSPSSLQQLCRWEYDMETI